MHSLRATRIAVVCVIAIAGTGSVSGARGATFVVNSTADDPPGPCETAAGGCTLREAIVAAVANPGRDTIAFDPAVFPLGTGTPIVLGSELPAIADPAGTVVDGAGAGVVLEQAFAGGGTTPIDGLLFASGPGVPLVDVTVANITVHGFPGAGVHICGGAPPDCEGAVSSPTIENVVATGNGAGGVRIEGSTVAEVTITGAVGTKNGDVGILCDASQSITGVHIERCAAHDNEQQGILVGGRAHEISDTAITNSIATHNRSGILVAGIERVAKTRLTDLGGVNNESLGIAVQTIGVASATTIVNSVGSGNESGGIEILADTITGASFTDVAGNGNGFGIFVEASSVATGVAFKHAKAVGNVSDGIGLVGVSGAKITGASVAGNGGVGLRVAGSNSVMKQVHASESGQDGIRLDAPGSRNRIESSRSTANQGPGISVQPGNTANTVQRNVALGNDAVDLFDGNDGCDADAWKKNVFENRNAPCIQ